MKKLIFAAALAALCSARAELLIQNNDRIPFLGDSITANGNRPAGYVNMVMKGLDSVWYGIQNIRAAGQQITVTINGQLALDYSLAKLTDGKVAPSGFKIPGHLPRPWSSIRTKGPIGFQGMHGGALP